MPYFYIISFLIMMPFTLFAKSSDHQCAYAGEPIKPFDSIWVEDAKLVNDAIKYYKQDNYTDAQITAALKNNDWTGFRLVCMPIVTQSQGDTQGSIAVDFEITGYALTLTEVSLDYYQSIKLHRKGLSAF
jgi:hypothetical protein